MDATYIFLQQYWWFLVSLLGALSVSYTHLTLQTKLEV